jgi:membrane protease YdiL (CAAX protease family)
VAYFVLAFAVSWAMWLAMIVFGISAVSGLGSGLFVACIFGPAISAVIVTLATSGKQGLRELVSRIKRWRVGMQWYLIALFGPIVLTLAAVGIGSMLGTTASPMERLDRLPPLVLTFLLMLLVNGPFSEELGWRGFALPRLEPGRSALRASLVLGMLWGIWHLPLFWVPDAPDAALIKGGAAGVLWIAGFIVNIIELTIILTWRFNRTGGSLLLAGVFHASVNTAFSSLELLGVWGNPTVSALCAGLFGLSGPRQGPPHF